MHLESNRTYTWGAAKSVWTCCRGCQYPANLLRSIGTWRMREIPQTDEERSAGECDLSDSPKWRQNRHGAARPCTRDQKEVPGEHSANGDRASAFGWGVRMLTSMDAASSRRESPQGHLIHSIIISAGRIRGGPDNAASPRRSNASQRVLRGDATAAWTPLPQAAGS